MTTIVVVDDEYLITDFLSFFLREAGYSVHVARDGKAGLDVIATVAPDLIITDFAVIACDKSDGGLVLVELAPNVTMEELNAKTGAAIDTTAFSRAA